MAKTLADVPAGRVWQAQQAAVMRLQLYTVGETHAALREVLAGCRKALDEAAPADGGEWDGMSIHLATEGCLKAWAAGFAEWKTLFEALRMEAAEIPLGTLAVLHNEAFGKIKPVREAARSTTPTPVFKPQLKAVTDVKAAADGAASRVYADGHDLSQRIWRLDQATMDGIRQTVLEGVASGDSAYRVAQRLEGYLGAGAGCPRWTRSRLYGLTKGDIAGGDRTGLYSGDECAGQGVSYNALRLARNEIQKAHAEATDALLSQIPWIEKEQIHLSPAHPEEDVCDDVISNGENGEGIYPKGEIQLPLHPQCLCYKSGVLQSPDEFAQRLRGWMRGTEDWPQMDEYAEWTGGSRESFAAGDIGLGMDIARRMVTWLWGGNGDLDAIVAERIAQAAGVA